MLKSYQEFRFADYFLLTLFYEKFVRFSHLEMVLSLQLLGYSLGKHKSLVLALFSNAKMLLIEVCSILNENIPSPKN